MSKAVASFTLLAATVGISNARAEDSLAGTYSDGPVAAEARRLAATCCGTASVSLMYDFSCARGATATPCFQGELARINPDVREAFTTFVRRLSPANRDLVSQRCGQIDDLFLQAKCAHEELSTSGSGTPAEREAALLATNRWGNNEQLWSMLSLACERVAGTIVLHGSGANQTLERARAPDAGCVQRPSPVNASAIPFEPSAAAAGGDPARPRPATPRRVSASPTPSGTPSNPLFDAYPPASLGGIQIPCPDFLPREFCGNGGLYDASRYRAERVETGTRPVPAGVDAVDVPIFETRYVYHEEGGAPIPASQLGNFMEGLFGTVKPQFEGDLRDFLMNLFAEKAVQASVLRGESNPTQVAALTERLAQAASCSKSAAARMKGLNQELAPWLQGGSSVSPALDQYRNTAAHAASCLGAVRARWDRLRNELGVDIQLTRPIITQEELDGLPPVVRHLARGITSLPFLRQVTRESEWFNGLSEYAERPCSFLQERSNPQITVAAREAASAAVRTWTMSRRTYCMNLFSEFTLLSQEMNSLYNTFPALAVRDATGNPAYRRVDAAASRPAAIQNYDIDLNRRSWGDLRDPQTSGPAFCMSRIAGGGAMPRAAPATRAALDTVMSQEQPQMIDEFERGIRDLCNPDRAREAVHAALRSPDLMGAFFDCNRRHFPTLLANFGSPTTSWPGALSSEACRDRQNSSWVACRLYRETRLEDIRGEILATTLQLGMDSLFFMAPGVGGFAPTLGTIGAQMAIGGTLGYALAPSAESVAAPSQFVTTSFLSGYASIDQYTEAVRALDRLKAHNPELDGLIEGMVMGAVFGAASEGTPTGSLARNFRGGVETALADAQSAARFEGSLIQAYRSLRARNAFRGAEGLAAEQELRNTILGTLRRRHPEISLEAFSRLAIDDQLAILERRMPPPGAAPHATVPEVARLRILGEPSVTRLVKQNGEFLRISAAQNTSYIALAEGGATAAGIRPALFFEAENALLKALNDSVFRSKDPSNAVVNLFKEALDRRVRGDPVLRNAIIGRYSDYKSIRYALSLDTPAVREALGRAYREATEEFAQTLRASPLRGLIDNQPGILGDPASWNLAGIGRTADEASLATRSARAVAASGGTPLQSFSNNLPFLRERLTMTEDLRASLDATLPPNSPILRPSVRMPGRRILSEESLELLRKAAGDTPSDLISAIQKKFKARFNVELTPDQARTLNEYYQSADSFSPSVIEAQRTRINLGNAQHGIVSVDIAGLGARNIAETMEGLVASRSDVSAAVRMNREGFTNVSNVELVGLRSAFSEAMDTALPASRRARARFSGDDGILMPARELTAADRLQVVSEISRRPEAARFRLTFVPSRYSNGGIIPNNLRSSLVTAAEKVEKDLRSALEGVIPREQSRRLFFAIDYHPTGTGIGSYNLILGGDASPAVIEQIRARFQTVMPPGHTAGEILRPGVTGGQWLPRPQTRPQTKWADWLPRFDFAPAAI